MRMSKVFISYSWDSDEHKRWVRRLSDELNSAGIETLLDEKDIPLGERFTVFMERSISESDFVLLVLTPEYKRKADNRLNVASGVGYEDQIMTNEVNDDNKKHRKYIPVLAKGSWTESTPIWAKGKRGVDFTTDSNRKKDWPLLVSTLKGKTAKVITPTTANRIITTTPSNGIVAPTPIIPVKKGGRVIAVGQNDEGQRNVSGWSDIAAVAAGDYHTVGLKRDGTVVAVGYNSNGQCDVSKWRNITAIAAGAIHTVGIVGE